MTIATGELARRGFDCIANMRQAGSLEQLSSSAGGLFEQLGLPHFAIARFFQADQAADVAVLAGSFHREWADRYLANRYVQHSDIAREMLLSAETYSWNDVLRRRRVGTAQKRIKNEAREMGLADGFFTPVRWADRSFSAVVLGGPRPHTEDLFVRTSAGVISAYYASEAKRLLTSASAKSLLTPRQRECLAWVRLGKSSYDIAEILKISAQTVDEHLKEACRRLGVRTRVQAAVEATLAGLIDG